MYIFIKELNFRSSQFIKNTKIYFEIYRFIVFVFYFRYFKKIYNPEVFLESLLHLMLNIITLNIQRGVINILK